MNPVATSDKPVGPRPQRLLEQVREKIRSRHYSIRTEQAYVDWIKRYIRFFDKQHPRELSAEHVERFLSHLASDLDVTVPTQEQAKAALLFLYKEVLGMELPGLDNIIQAKAPKRLAAASKGGEALQARENGAVYAPTGPRIEELSPEAERVAAALERANKRHGGRDGRRDDRTRARRA